MKLIERYILRRTSLMFLGTLLPLLGIVWTTQALTNVNLVTDSGQSMLAFLKLDPATPLIWPRLAVFLLMLLSGFYIPAALDPCTHRFAAIFAVVCRFAGFFFFAAVGGRYIILGLYDLVFGAPQAISAVIRGAKMYDPRADSTFSGGSGSQRLNDPTTWAWSDNPAICWAWYRTLAAPLGPGWATDRINWQSVFDAADDCDALVAIPTSSTEKRFRCDLVADTSMEPREERTQPMRSHSDRYRLITSRTLPRSSANC